LENCEYILDVYEEKWSMCYHFSEVPEILILEAHSCNLCKSLQLHDLLSKVDLMLPSRCPRCQSPLWLFNMIISYDAHDIQSPSSSLPKGTVGENLSRSPGKERRERREEKRKGRTIWKVVTPIMEK
jgi:hypothetical protein